MKIRPVPQSTQRLASLVGTGLGRFDGFNPKMLLALAVILFLTDVGYEGQRSSHVFPWLLLYSPASIAVFLVVFAGLFLIVRRIGSNAARSISLIVAAMIAAAAKSLVLMLLIHGDEFFPSFEERIAGDPSIAAVYMVVAAVISLSYSNHIQVVEELNRVSLRLAEQKSTTIAVASDVESELHKKANAALGAELDRIAQSSERVLDSVETSALKLQIQALVRNQVRPLSRELQSRVQILRNKSTTQLQKSSLPDIWKLRIIPRIDSSFVASYVIAIPNIVFTVASKAGLANALLVAAVSLSYPLIGRGLQFGLSRKKLPIAYVLNIPAIVSVIAYLPTGIVMHNLSLQFPLVGVTIFTAAGVLIFTCIAATAWFALHRTRDENAAEILRVNAEIRHELDLLDQAVWVAQRKWSYIIHGTVQGALTVASSRLEMANKPTEELKLAVRSDIERAKTVLISPPTFDRPANELFSEIADTWQGVCDFEYQIAPSAEAALAKSQTSTTCLVEIIKELVSNANRHGGANKFWINCYLNPEGDLSIVAGNNGKIVPAGAAGGLGYEMISQLTKDWSLAGGVSNNFTATLPIPRGREVARH